ncbi:unnamed protein product [Nezara viridula]|uniref:Uncharacterized protein n=1 Tax=Nezara viridula TaxID=85310 RepID=A0A9P0EAV0_NEZVI|nr:unnamed protein product [Nezara viridula]
MNFRVYEKIKAYMDNSSIHGLKYITQSGRHWSERSIDSQKFIINKEIGPGRLEFKVSKDVIVYMHTTEDVPFINTPQEAKHTVILGSNFKMKFTVTEIVNDLLLDTISIEQRKCRFHYENNLEAYKHYSYSGCIVNCRAKAQINFCQCLHHFMPKIKIIGSLKTIDSNKPGLVCPCIPSCTEHDHHVRAPCEEFLGNCTWNGEPFECCSQFLPLKTELGLCYTINSLHTKSKLKKLVLKSNKKTGPGKLRFQVYEAAKLFIHSTDDVPYINHPLEEKAVLNWGTVYSMSFQVNEIDNDPALRDVSVEQRNCRFPHENILDVYDYYSYSTCVVNCRTKAQIEFCNCTHHFIPHQETLRALRTEDNEKKGLVCNCMSSCIEPEYTIINKAQITNEESLDNGTKVSVIMDTLPSQRFKRNVVRTRLDLVVSMGGTAGLFLGASLLSIVELLVYIFFRGNTKKEIRTKSITLINKKASAPRNVYTIAIPKKINITNNQNRHIKGYLKSK